MYNIQKRKYNATDTQTHRHTDTQTHRHTDTQTHRHIDRQTHTHTQTHTHKNMVYYKQMSSAMLCPYHSLFLRIITHTVCQTQPKSDPNVPIFPSIIIC
jgi:hypothetical protein